MFDYALGEAVSDTGDAELGGSFESFLVDPSYVVRIVAIELNIVSKRVFFRPKQNPGVFDAMLSKTRSVGDGA